MRTRISLPAIVAIVRNLTMDQIEAVIDMGFGGLVDLKYNHLDRDFCGWLVSKFDPDECCLNVHGKKVPITLLDVENLLGIRSTGQLLAEDSSKEDISELCHKYGFVAGQLNVTRLRDDLKYLTDAGDEFKCRFVLLALGRMYCPGTKSGIKASLIHFVKDPSLLSKFNWGWLLLDHLQMGVRSFKKKNTSGGCVSGCLFLLMVILLESLRFVLCMNIIITLVISICLFVDFLHGEFCSSWCSDGQYGHRIIPQTGFLGEC